MRFGLVTLVLMLGANPAGAQWLDLKTPGIPRTPDGKPNLTAPAPRGPNGKPDLSGVWNGPDPAPRIDPANAHTWVNDLARDRAQEFFKTRPAYACLPSGPEAPAMGDAGRHRDPQRRPHLSRDLCRRPPARAQSRPELDGIFSRTLGRRRARRGQQRIQRQDVGEPQWALAYGEAARARTLSACGLRPPRDGSHLYRCGCVREALGLHRKDAVGG